MSDPSGDADLDLPSRLQEDLRQLCATPPTAAMQQRDHEILNAARAQLARGQRWRPLRWAGAAAAAALVLIAVRLLWLSSPVPGDIDANGRVDIVDALVLAKQVEAGGASGDLTRDGVVDRRDVERIAMLAVRLSPAGGAQ